MIAVLPDTSFLWALYGQRSNSAAAQAAVVRLNGPLPISSLLRFEFEQAVRFAVFRHRNDPATGLTEGFATAMLVDFEAHLAEGLHRLAPFDWAAVCDRAQRLSEKHTMALGHRAFDILHVATALQLGAHEFLTFDANQRRLAEAEGLRVPF